MIKAFPELVKTWFLDSLDLSLMENVWADLTRLLYQELERLKGTENLKKKNLKKRGKSHDPKMCYKFIET